MNYAQSNGHSTDRLRTRLHSGEAFFGDGGFGRYEAIEPHTNGNDRVYSAASEMRADGCALAY